MFSYFVAVEQTAINLNIKEQAECLEIMLQIFPW